jgi:hypothetical protein
MMMALLSRGNSPWGVLCSIYKTTPGSTTLATLLSTHTEMWPGGLNPRAIHRVLEELFSYRVHRHHKFRQVLVGGVAVDDLALGGGEQVLEVLGVGLLHHAVAGLVAHVSC